jgi:hypothetical protein
MPARRASKRDDLRWVAFKARSCFTTLRAQEAGALYIAASMVDAFSNPQVIRG